MMFSVIVRTQILLLLVSLAVLIVAEDGNTASFFPMKDGNDTNFDLAAKIIDSTSFHPDATQAPSTLIPQQLLPPNYYLPGKKEFSSSFLSIILSLKKIS